MFSELPVGYGVNGEGNILCDIACIQSSHTLSIRPAVHIAALVCVVVIYDIPHKSTDSIVSDSYWAHFNLHFDR